MYGESSVHILELVYSYMKWEERNNTTWTSAVALCLEHSNPETRWPMGVEGQSLYAEKKGPDIKAIPA